MSRRNAPKIKGGEQLDFFDLLAPTEPEPATMAGPARPRLATVPAAVRVPEPMTAAAVAWIEQHVIADYHLANERTFGDPDQNWETRCACQIQFPCGLCRDGRHDRCRQQEPAGSYLAAPQPETHLRAPAPYRTNRPAPYVPVWLADRACRTQCSCEQCADQSAPTTVVCLKGRQGDPLLTDPRFVYVGRPQFQGGWKLHGHPLSNPYKVGKDGSAEQVVERYREWLLRRPGLTHQLLELRGRVLGCWCADGQPCHARVLAEMADGVVDV